MVRLLRKILDQNGFHKIRNYSSLQRLPRAPSDKIFGLVEMFNSDDNPKKVNLTAGIYKDNNGKSWLLPSVRKAQKILANDANLLVDLSYLPIVGSKTFRKNVKEFLFTDCIKDANSTLLEDDRIAFVQTLSGTGALSVGADFLSRFISNDVWIPSPSWPNHYNIFKNRGFKQLHFYSYYENGQLNFEKWMNDLETSVKRDASGRPHSIILHACCHNPTGFDPSKEQWQKVIDTIYRLQMVPIIDMAYQGLESGNVIDDAYLLRMVTDEKKYPSWNNGVLLCQSFSKNMGLYGERVGSLSMILPPIPSIRETVESQLKTIIRSSYSSPPGYGCMLAGTVLSSEELKKQWFQDVKSIWNRLIYVRKSMHEKLQWPSLVDFKQHHGMFYFTGLTPNQVSDLRNYYSIYLTMDGRLSISGVNDKNIDYVCSAIKKVST